MFALGRKAYFFFYDFLLFATQDWRIHRDISQDEDVYEQKHRIQTSVILPQSADWYYD